jgi:hypothetical protein
LNSLPKKKDNLVSEKHFNPSSALATSTVAIERNPPKFSGGGN